MPPIANNAYSPGKYFYPVIIFILCMLLYGNTLYNGYALDDCIYTYKNDFIIKGFSAFKDIFSKGSIYGFDKARSSGTYRPLVLLNFMAEVSLFGLNPHISHFFNVLFFAFSAVILYFLLQKILKNYNPAITIAATLLFAFHPIHTEVVANIKSRDEILGFLFGLISFYYIMLSQEKKNSKYYFFSLTAFFAAIFCKEDCLTYIAIIPLLLYFFTSTEIKKIVFKTIPYFGLVAIYLLIRSRVLKNMTFTNTIPVIDNALMAAKNSAEMTATSFVLLGKYIYMTIFPYPLSWDYSYNQIPIVSWGNIKPILSLLVSAAMIGYMIWGIRKKSLFSFLIALFFITLLLSANLIIRIPATFGERFLYVPSLSLCIALPVLAAKTFKLNPAKIAWKEQRKFYIPVICLLIVYTIIVIPRNAEWKNNYTLFSSGVITAPNSARTHEWLAIEYSDSAQSSQNTPLSLHYYALAAWENKKSTELYSMNPESYYSLGVSYFGEGNLDSAIAPLEKALELRPEYPSASNCLGLIYFNKKQYDAGLSYFFKSLKADSVNLDALKNIGATYQNEQNYALAFHYDSLALKEAPGDKATLNNLSVMHNHLGVQYVNSNELDKALEEFFISVKCDSASTVAIGNIGVIYQKKGDFEKAKTFYRKALSINPKNEALARNLQLLNRAQQ